MAFAGVVTRAAEERAKDICPVHHVKMEQIEATVVSAAQGAEWRKMVARDAGSYEAYEEAVSSHFPFAERTAYWSAELKMPEAFQKYVCPECFIARVNWLRAREQLGSTKGKFPLQEEAKELKDKPKSQMFVVHSEDEQRDDDAATDLYRHLQIHRWKLQWKPSEKAESFNVSLWRVDRGPDGIKKETRLAGVSGECGDDEPPPNIRIMVDKNASTVCNYGSACHGAGFCATGPLSFSKAEPLKIGSDRYLLIEVMDQVGLANGTKIPGGVIQSLEVSVEEKKR